MTTPFRNCGSEWALLEQDNRELRTALAQRSGAGFGSDAVTPLIAVVPPAPEEEIEETDEEKRIGMIVDRRMRKLGAMQPNQADDVQDMKIGALENSMGGLMKKLNGPTTALGNFSKDGVFLTSNDGQFKTHIGGLVQMDYVNINSGDTNFPAGSYGAGGNSMEGFQFRRLRLRAEGTMYQNIDWVSEVDLAFALQNVDPLGTATPVTGLRGATTSTTTSKCGKHHEHDPGDDNLCDDQGHSLLREHPSRSTTGLVQQWNISKSFSHGSWTSWNGHRSWMRLAGPNNNGYMRRCFWLSTIRTTRLLELRIRRI